MCAAWGVRVSEAGVCVCVAQQSTSRDRAQLGRVGCVCVGGGLRLFVF